MHVTTLGIDVAKQVFQLHEVDARGHAVLSRRVKRSRLVAAVASLPPCVIGMEAQFDSFSVEIQNTDLRERG
jgi:transposase